MGLLEDLFQIGDGVRSGITDAPSFIGDVLTGDFHAAVTDGRNVIGDVVGILEGAEGLGVSLGEIPKRYLGTAAKIADSKILSAAQLAIEGQKKLTGSGDPADGNGYKDSADWLDKTVETLVDAAPHEDRWDGAAAEAYGDNNGAHRRYASGTGVADRAIADVIALEAAQVVRTRDTLDDASQQLYDFGLATSWMMFIPPLIPAKVTADLLAASMALGTTTTAIGILAKNSMENASRIRDNRHFYDEVIANDTSGSEDGCDVGVTPQTDDLKRLPRRIAKGDTYTVPAPETRDQGPPATPYEGQPNIGTAPGPAASSPPLNRPGPPAAAPQPSRPGSPALSPRQATGSRTLPSPPRPTAAAAEPAVGGRAPTPKTPTRTERPRNG